MRDAFGGLGMFVVVGLAFVVISGFAIWRVIRGFKAAQARRVAISAMATAKGYQYLGEYDLRSTLLRSAPFGTGDSRRARDVVWGRIGSRPFESFAYSYETRSDDSNGNTITEVHPYQVTWVPLPAPIATMRFTGDDVLQRLLSKMGARDLVVESHEFNQRWKVWCEDERVGHAVLTPTLINNLLSPGWNGRGLVIEGQVLMTYTAGHTDLAELEPVVGALYRVLDDIPAFLRGA